MERKRNAKEAEGNSKTEEGGGKESDSKIQGDMHRAEVV